MTNIHRWTLCFRVLRGAQVLGFPAFRPGHQRWFSSAGFSRLYQESHALSDQPTGRRGPILAPYGR